MSASTFSDNSASEYGGALSYRSADGLSLINDTFDGNTAPLGGGALYFEAGATTGEIVLLNDTIAHNTSIDGGGIYDPELADTIENTIVAENHGVPGSDGGADCWGTARTDNAAAADVGGNIDSDGTCFSEGVNGDRIDTDPRLAPLAGNGGPTETDALLPGSPAIGDAVSEPLACPANDQRGIARSGLCDIGAYQTTPVQGSVSAPASPSPPASPAGGTSGTGQEVGHPVDLQERPLGDDQLEGPHRRRPHAHRRDAQRGAIPHARRHRPPGQGEPGRTREGHRQHRDHRHRPLGHPLHDDPCLSPVRSGQSRRQAARCLPDPRLSPPPPGGPHITGKVSYTSTSPPLARIGQLSASFVAASRESAVRIE